MRFLVLIISFQMFLIAISCFLVLKWILTFNNHIFNLEKVIVLNFFKNYVFQSLQIAANFWILSHFQFLWGGLQNVYKNITLQCLLVCVDECFPKITHTPKTFTCLWTSANEIPASLGHFRWTCRLQFSNCLLSN